MADVAEENKVIDATAAPVEEVKETVKEVVKEDAAAGEVVAEAPAAPAEPAEKVEETKEVENGNSEEVPKENGTAKDENGTAENGSAEGEADAERKRKTEVVADETDGTPAEGVSAEKKAKLEEKSEDGGVAETPSNGDQGVVV
jgi:hypothetical protein